MEKIAFLFLTLDNINHPSIWEEYFKGNEDKISIYCHPKYPDKVNIPWLKKNIINHLVETKWGSITSAYFNLMEEAFQDKNNIKFIFISESCIPLWNFKSLYDYVMKDKKVSFIKKMRISKWHLEHLIHSQENYQKYNFIKHYARACLSRYHINILLKKKEDFDNFFNKMHIGDEYFLTLLQPLNYIKDMEITFDNWDLNTKFEKLKYTRRKLMKNKKSKKKLKQIEKELDFFKDETILQNPKTYMSITIKDIKQARKSGAFFWRKIHKDCHIIPFEKELLKKK